MLRDLTLYEGVDVEFKAAKGGLPRDLWETYSAFANTYGGTIWLGITQGETALDMHGVENAEKLVSDFWNTINNRGKVCLNLLTNDLLEIVPIEGSPRKLIRIRVPRAGRRERPVFLGSDPFRGTYRRNFEGDYLCRDDEGRRMFADQSEEPADTRYRLVSGDSLHKAEDSSHKDSDSLHKTGDSSHWVATTVTDEMRVTAEPAWQSSRIAPAKLEQILVALCSGQFVPLDLLAEAVKRNAEGLRNRYLTPLVRQGRLRLRFSDRKNRPDQAYLAVGDK